MGHLVKPQRAGPIGFTGYLLAVAGQRGAHRAAFENHSLLRYTASHLLAVNAEWAIFLALLVYTYGRSGRVRPVSLRS